MVLAQFCLYTKQGRDTIEKSSALNKHQNKPSRYGFVYYFKDYGKRAIT
jgi:hypothetical protein